MYYLCSMIIRINIIDSYTDNLDKRQQALFEFIKAKATENRVEMDTRRKTPKEIDGYKGMDSFLRALGRLEIAGKTIVNTERSKVVLTKDVSDYYRRRHLLKHFNLTLEEYNEILKLQGGVCAICGNKESGGSSDNLSVDHNHTTGEIRGLLCMKCNVGIGNLKENTLILSNAINYLCGIRKTNNNYLTSKPIKQWNKQQWECMTNLSLTHGNQTQNLSSMAENLAGYLIN